MIDGKELIIVNEKQSKELKTMMIELKSNVNWSHYKIVSLKIIVLYAINLKQIVGRKQVRN